MPVEDLAPCSSPVRPSAYEEKLTPSISRTSSVVPISSDHDNVLGTPSRRKSKTPAKPAEKPARRAPAKSTAKLPTKIDSIFVAAKPGLVPHPEKPAPAKRPNVKYVKPPRTSGSAKPAANAKKAATRKRGPPTSNQAIDQTFKSTKPVSATTAVMAEKAKTAIGDSVPNLQPLSPKNPRNNLSSSFEAVKSTISDSEEERSKCIAVA